MFGSFRISDKHFLGTHAPLLNCEEGKWHQHAGKFIHVPWGQLLKIFWANSKIQNCAVNQTIDPVLCKLCSMF